MSGTASQDMSILLSAAGPAAKDSQPRHTIIQVPDNVMEMCSIEHGEPGDTTEKRWSRAWWMFHECTAGIFLGPTRHECRTSIREQSVSARMLTLKRYQLRIKGMAIIAASTLAIMFLRL